MIGTIISAPERAEEQTSAATGPPQVRAASWRRRTQDFETDPRIGGRIAWFERFRGWSAQTYPSLRTRESSGVDQLSSAGSKPGGAQPVLTRWARMSRISTGSWMTAMTVISHPV